MLGMRLLAGEIEAGINQINCTCGYRQNEVGALMQVDNMTYNTFFFSPQDNAQRRIYLHDNPLVGRRN